MPRKKKSTVRAAKPARRAGRSGSRRAAKLACDHPLKVGSYKRRPPGGQAKTQRVSEHKRCGGGTPIRGADGRFTTPAARSASKARSSKPITKRSSGRRPSASASTRSTSSVSRRGAQRVGSPRAVDVVDVEVAIGPRPPNLVGTHRDVVLDGRVVARRIAAHHSVVLGDGVKVIDGKFPPRAGSDARPQLLASTSKPVRLLVRHVPMALATTMHKLYGAKLRRKRSA